MKSNENQRDAVKYLAEIENLMRLLDENPFKVRAFEKAQTAIATQTDLVLRAKNGTLIELPGIGKGIADTLTPFLLKGDTAIRDELEAKVPNGLLELVKVPGLGPKKAKLLINELEIHSLGELEYACKENRLVKLDGFGEKTQEKILKGIESLRAFAGKIRIDQAEGLAERGIGLIKARFLKESGRAVRVEMAGAFRRRVEVIDSLEFLIEAPHHDWTEWLRNELELESNGVSVHLYFATPENFGSEWMRLTGSDLHLSNLQERGLPQDFPQDFKDEEKGYSTVGLKWIPPELREGSGEFDLGLNGIQKLPSESSIQGIFHCHTTQSDGSASLEQMVGRALQLGYRYIGISDHSQSAVYARGLNKSALEEQEREVRSIQEKYPEIKIFWGIESDILADGALDYEVSQLKRFDFVIASIHSRFKMDQKEMTHRMVRAIRNPYTRMIGHLTGRIVLGRHGYELDFEKVFKEAAQQDVAIEINAHPARLDVDWRWGDLLRAEKTKVSINPDAHDLKGLEDVRFGVTVARKALLASEQVINTHKTDWVEKWLSRK